MSANPGWRLQPLQEIDLKPVAAVRNAYEKLIGPAASGGRYSIWDWHRIAFVLARLPKGGRILEVGIGAGQLFNLLSLRGDGTKVVGLDVQAHSELRLLVPEPFLVKGSVEQLPFVDRSFDVVICMEVLEHVPLWLFRRALPELRRVCRSRLIMSVPYCEPEPLPKWHRLRFDDERIGKFFPKAQGTLLLRHDQQPPWLLLEESRKNADGPLPDFLAAGASVERLDVPSERSLRLDEVNGMPHGGALKAFWGVVDRLKRLSS